MASFGSKEHWMEPMNAFLGTHRESFKSFIDDICTCSPTDDAKIAASSQKPTSYSTPLAIRSRLPPTSREGFPSLPYLIDQPREFASLVELWLHGTASKDGSESIAMAIGKEDGDLLSLHTMCTQLSARTQECLARAERAERPNSSLSFRWEELIDQLQNSTGLGPASRPQSKEEAVRHDLAFGGGRDTFDLETPTRDSFDDVAMRAAGEAAARARGARMMSDSNSEAEEAIIEEDESSPQVFENDRDGGAASVAASILQQEHSTMSLDRRAGMHFRSSFDMHRPGNILSSLGGAVSSSGSGQLQSSHTISNFSSSREPTTSSMRDRAERDREIARDIEASLSGAARRNNFASATAVARGGSAHGSSTSGGGLSNSENDSNATTALPSMQKERERREREKEKLKKREKEERERRLKDFVPLANMVGGLRGRRKDKKESAASGGLD